MARWRVKLSRFDGPQETDMASFAVDAESEGDALRAALAEQRRRVLAATGELIEDGQEEASSRTEIEQGRAD